jgi:hypothetical protein
MSGRVLIGLVALLLVAAVPGAATADVPPPYTGDMTFPQITDPSGPEEFTWQVQLNDNRVLEAINEEFAAVYFKESHVVNVLIAAEHAHDASGASVPTSLVVTEPDLITLVVHHRAGNPAEGGASFDYPITAGAGWTVIEQGGTVPSEVVVASDEEIPNSFAFQQFPRIEPSCRVPSLRGRSLRTSRHLLLASDCRVGAIRRRRGATGKTAKVVRQSPRPGTELAGGSPVAVTLGA